MKDLDRFPGDSMVATDAWDHTRDLIGANVNDCELLPFHPECIPFFEYFETSIKRKLKKVGFKKETLENPLLLERAVKALEDQGFECFAFLLNDSLVNQCGFPAKTITISEDKKSFWIKSDIEAALRALESIAILKGLLVNNDAVKVYLRTLELTINLVRAGNVPAFAISEADKIEKSLKTRELKKFVMRCIIDNIFKKNPQRPKTLGEVWNKIDSGHGRIRLTKNKKIYVAEIGKEGGKDVIIIKGYIEKAEKDANGKDIVKDVSGSFIYAKRSLHKFINELKNTPLEVTQ